MFELFLIGYVFGLTTIQLFKLGEFLIKRFNQRRIAKEVWNGKRFMRGERNEY